MAETTKRQKIMGQSLNVAKKHIVEYANSGWFYGHEGNVHFHKVLRLLDVHYSMQNDDADNETEFEVERRSLAEGLAKLRTIAHGGDVDWVDEDELKERLEKADMSITECIDCFEWLLNKGDKENEKDWVYVSFF